VSVPLLSELVGRRLTPMADGPSAIGARDIRSALPVSRPFDVSDSNVADTGRSIQSEVAVTSSAAFDVCGLPKVVRASDRSKEAISFKLAYATKRALRGLCPGRSSAF
jgi:hypothetical protein